MHNSRVAGRYAKALLDLAIEQNSLDSTAAEVKALANLIKNSAELKAFLRSPIIKGGTKQTIMTKMFGQALSPLFNAFLKLVVRKGRESNTADILGAFMEQYNALKGINQVKLVTAAPVEETTVQSILESIKKTTPLTNIELETSVDESLIGGYVLELRDYLVDASIKRELALVKRRFVSNEYQYNIR